MAKHDRPLGAANGAQPCPATCLSHKGNRGETDDNTASAIPRLTVHTRTHSNSSAPDKYPPGRASRNRLATASNHAHSLSAPTNPRPSEKIRPSALPPFPGSHAPAALLLAADGRDDGPSSAPSARWSFRALRPTA